MLLFDVYSSSPVKYVEANCNFFLTEQTLVVMLFNGENRVLTADDWREWRGKGDTLSKKKQRTREHIIADLSVNYIERFALLCGYTIEKFATDYGYDVNVYTYNDDGEIENGNVYLQLKATDHLHLVHEGDAVSMPLKKKDLQLWLEEPLPVILIVYDAIKHRAYWLYVQAYFERLSDFDIHQVNHYYTVNIPLKNRVNTRSMKKFATFKHQVLTQINQRRIRHYV